LDHFYDEVTRGLGLSSWGRNLDAFNDVLRGGFGTPAGGFVFRWNRSEEASQLLGYPETVRYLERKATRCHPSNVPGVMAAIEMARRGEGQTVFDILVEIIRDHGETGQQSGDCVDLELA
nr:barstar family protein [Deltaproteobacteria bacterium]